MGYWALASLLNAILRMRSCSILCNRSSTFASNASMRFSTDTELRREHKKNTIRNQAHPAQNSPASGPLQSSAFVNTRRTFAHISARSFVPHQVCAQRCLSADQSIQCARQLLPWRYCQCRRPQHPFGCDHSPTYPLMWRGSGGRAGGQADRHTTAHRISCRYCERRHAEERDARWLGDNQQVTNHNDTLTDTIHRLACSRRLPDWPYSRQITEALRVRKVALSICPKLIEVVKVNCQG